MVSHQKLLYSNQSAQNVILVAEGVDQLWVSTFSGAAESHHQSILLVATHHCEDVWRTNYVLSDLDECCSPELLVFPQGEKCMKHLLIDPRVHKLISNTVDNGGWVAFGTGAELVLSQIPLKYRVADDRICLQRSKKTADFAHQLFSSKTA